jgi:hypothetical protein
MLVQDPQAICDSPRIEGHPAVVFRISQTDVSTSADATDGVTRSVPFGRGRGGGGLVELDHGLRFLLGQPHDQVVVVATAEKRSLLVDENEKDRHCRP